MLRGKRWNYHWIWGLHFQTQICSYHCPHIPLRCFLEVEILNLWFFFFAWLHFHSFRGNLKSIWEWFLDFGSGESMRIPDPPAQESQKEHDALSAELKQEQQHLASQRRLRPAAPRSFGSCWFHVPQSVPQRISKMDNVHFDSFHHTTCTPRRLDDEMKYEKDWAVTMLCRLRCSETLKKTQLMQSDACILLVPDAHFLLDVLRVQVSTGCTVPRIGFQCFLFVHVWVTIIPFCWLNSTYPPKMK